MAFDHDGIGARILLQREIRAIKLSFERFRLSDYDTLTRDKA